MRRMTVLIVDDNEPMRRALKALVGDFADAVYECTDGVEALAAYAAHRPDWVLMDIEMVKLDGLAATRQIKAYDPAARVVIVTAYDDAELRERAREAGAFAFVAKENLMDLHGILGADGAP